MPDGNSVLELNIALFYHMRRLKLIDDSEEVIDMNQI